MSSATLAFYLLYAASGATALAYEVLWERALRLSFGISTYSVALVTAAFMGGLSIGYALGRSRHLESRRPLAVYAAAEAGIALYAVAFPVLHAAVDAAYLGSGGSLAVRAILAFGLLLPPTVLMGITLPVGTRWLAERTTSGRAAAGLLAANTLGGVAGTLVTGWWLIRVFGASRTGTVAIVLNLAIAGLAFLLARSPAGAVTPAERAPAPGAPPAWRGTPAQRWALAVAAGIAGFQTMAPQVVWNRTLICVVENNTTSFALILASVLLGSAIGAFVYLIVGPRLGDVRRNLWLFFAAEVVYALYLVGSVSVLNRLYDVGDAITAVWPLRSTFDVCMVRWLVALVPVAPAAAAGAFLLPVLTELREPRSASEGAGAVSSVFSAEALGSVVGSLAAGFWLIPRFGLGPTLLAIGVLGLANGVLLLAVFTERRGRAIGAAATAAIVVTAVAAGAGPLTLTRWYDGHQKIQGDLKYYHEGVSGTISVLDVNGRKELLINCIEEVPNHRDALLLFRLLAHTPLLLHGEPKDVLVNALGGGIVLGSVLQHDVRVSAVELVPEVREAMRFFSEENNAAANRTDWTLIPDDGRNYLRVTDEEYDVVTADATHPAAGESWPLYTREYYEIVRSHLRPGGIFAQWLPLHNMAPPDFLATMRTFREAFPNMLVLFANRYSVLVGSERQFELDPAELERRMKKDPNVAADLAPYGIETGADLLKYVVLDGEGVDRLTAEAHVLTDDHPSVEFAELNRLGLPETFSLDLRLLADALDPAALAERTGVPRAIFEARKLLLQAQLQRRQPTLEATFDALVTLEGARELAPRDQDVQVAIDTLQGAMLRSIAADYQAILDSPELQKTTQVLHYAVGLHPDDPFLNQLLGAAFLKLRRWQDAVPYLERAAAERPDDLNYRSNLAYAYEQAGRFDDALEALGRLAESDPVRAPVYEKVRERVRRRMSEAAAAGGGGTAAEGER